MKTDRRDARALAEACLLGAYHAAHRLSDPQRHVRGRLLVRDLLRELRARGTAVFLNSHLLGEVEATCDRVAFVKQGRIVHELSLADAPSGLDVELRIAGPEDRPAEAGSHEAIMQGLARFGSQPVQANGIVHLRVEHEASLPALVRWLVERGVNVYGLQSRRKSLEQWFVEVMGEDQRPG
ncbi:MAG: hypothetical protein HYS05_12820 [Acidobacteria bacterium]|nr:hypothetical protein [Acidobacteriota bacterium]